jgi:23S rRNA pseudouridine1911/1915/1917 synthase
LKTTVKESTTLLGFLTLQYPDSPRTRIKKLLKGGAVRINDRQVTLHSYPLKPGDVVVIETHQGSLTADRLPFPVLYEDKEVIVIDKPPGISTSSTDGSNSIQNIVSGALRDQSKGKVKAFVVHRLDKEVSGVLLLAKTAESMNRIKDTWKETEKHYYAFVEGTPAKTEDTIKSWLIEDSSQKMHSTFEREEAKFAVTHYKVLKSVNKFTLVDVRTETGRKNQIRVHMSDLGCPIIGDRKYGAADEFKRRVRLHAYQLSFPHPVTGKVIKVESPMPNGFLTLKPKDEHYKTPLYFS